MKNSSLKQRNQRKLKRSFQTKQKITVGFLSCGVIFGTVAALTLPANTLNGYICGMEEHVHSATCQTPAEGGWNCQAEQNLHVHGEDCYDAFGESICGQADFAVHIHEDICYSEEGDLFCTLPEIEEHIHGDECYLTLYEETLAEETVSPHLHTDECYLWTVGDTLLCDLEESSGHTHSEYCYPIDYSSLFVSLGGNDTSAENDIAETEADLPVCGYEESEAHFHGDDCYELLRGELICGFVEDETAAYIEETEAVLPSLICTLPEIVLHTHDGTCYSLNEVTGELFLSCGMVEITAHQHEEDCFIRDIPEDESSLCTLEEHAHTDECRPDPDADVETPEDWEATLPVLEGTWAEDVLAIASSQIGYEESKRNAEIGENGMIYGYTRYGAWAGDPYGDWNTLFADFCLRYADIPEAILPFDANPVTWMDLVAAEGLLRTTDMGDPASGDLLFLDRDGDGIAESAGILEYVPALETTDENGLSTVAPEAWFTIEGDVDNCVTRVEYLPETIVGYVSMEDVRSAYEAFLEYLIYGETFDGDSALNAFVGTYALEDLAEITPITTITGENGRLVADPNTMMDWQANFSRDGTVTPLSTEFAGGVWTDKSVFAANIVYNNAGNTENGTLTSTDDTFLVALSAISSTQSVSGISSAPTDVMFILDMSSSMYPARTNDSRQAVHVQNMVTAVNNAIKRLHELNPANRCGVTIYSGGGTIPTQATHEHGMVLMPLGRYTADNDLYIRATTYSGGGLKGIATSASLMKWSNYNADQVYDQNDHSDLTTKFYENFIKATSVSYNVYEDDSAVHGTYAQLGIYHAMEEFLDTTDVTFTQKILDTAATSKSVTYVRRPVFVLMSDGLPTAATENYSFDAEFSRTTYDPANPLDATMGNNSNRYRNSWQCDFSTQLTAAYAKYMVDEHYSPSATDTDVKDETPLFYTLGLVTDSYYGVSMDVMDPGYTATNNVIRPNLNDTSGTSAPSINITEKITNAWETLVNAGTLTLTGDDRTKRNDDNNNNAGEFDISVEHTYERVTNSQTGTFFPSSTEQQNYVDRYFEATSSDQLVNAFNNIVAAISLQEAYEATFVANQSIETSGYVTFVDTIGEHMEVKNIKGILYEGELQAGADLTAQFANADFTRPNDNTDPTNEEMFITALAEDLFIETLDNTNFTMLLALVDAARDEGQFARVVDADGNVVYNGNTPATVAGDGQSYNNYIGWYANVNPENGKTTYLSFWDGKTAIPTEAEWLNSLSDPTVPRNQAAIDEGLTPTHVIQSHYHIGVVEDGTTTQSMLYITEWLRRDIRPDSKSFGQQSVVFAVPASLLPSVYYQVHLNADLTPRNMEAVGADVPIVLVYEVGLAEDVDIAALVDEVAKENFHKFIMPGQTSEENEKSVDLLISYFQAHFEIIAEPKNDALTTTYHEVYEKAFGEGGHSVLTFEYFLNNYITPSVDNKTLWQRFYEFNAFTGQGSMTYTDIVKDSFVKNNYVFDIDDIVNRLAGFESAVFYENRQDLIDRGCSLEEVDAVITKANAASVDLLKELIDRALPIYIIEEFIRDMREWATDKSIYQTAYRDAFGDHGSEIFTEAQFIANYGTEFWEDFYTYTGFVTDENAATYGWTYRQLIKKSFIDEGYIINPEMISNIFTNYASSLYNEPEYDYLPDQVREKLNGAAQKALLTIMDKALIESPYLADVGNRTITTDPTTGEITSEYYTFYTNTWERDRQTGFDRLNTYAYYRPSLDNDRYYYTGYFGAVKDIIGATKLPEWAKETTWLYREAVAGEEPEVTVPLSDGTSINLVRVPYANNDLDTSGETYYYSLLFYYKATGTGDRDAQGLYTAEEHVCARIVGGTAIDNLQNKKEAGTYTGEKAPEHNGYWRIPNGTPHSLKSDAAIARFALTKDSNTTNTLGYSVIPQFSASGNPEDLDNSFLIANTLGNNGLIHVYPVTVSGTKTVEGYPDFPFDEITFDIELYKAVWDGTEYVTEGLPSKATFDEDGKFTFPDLYMTGVGTYHYIVKEAPKTGYFCDDVQYLIEVQVVNPTGTGTNIITTSLSKRNGNNGSFTSSTLTEQTLEFSNSVGVELPSTGGEGTKTITFAGLGLITISLLGIGGAVQSKKRRLEVKKQ